MFSSFGSLVGGSMRGKGVFARKVATAQLLQTSQQVLAVLFPDMHHLLAAKTFKDGTLMVTCAFGADSQAVLFAVDEIRLAINERLGGEQVLRVVVRMT